MNEVVRIFNIRSKEIDIYFKFLLESIEKEAGLYFSNNLSHKVKKIDQELIKIFKANGFLLLYNLVESTIRNSLVEIYVNVNQDRVKYNEIKSEFKKIWIEHKYKNFKDKGSKDILEIINNIDNDIIENLVFDHKKVISGNIDSRKIEELSILYGFSKHTHYFSKSGSCLFKVKNNRNQLAHGLVSFSECGRDYTIQELIQIKKELVSYIRGILKNIKKFIDNKDYK